VPTNIADFEHALRYCFLLLKYRKRSEAELKKRLRLKKCPLPVQDKAVAYLKESNLIPTDTDFAREWAEYKLSGGYGINRITADLCKRGIGRQALDDIKTLFKTEKKEDVRRTIADLIAKKRRPGELDYARKQKLVRFLLQRGFLLGEVLEVMDESPGS